MVSEKCADPLLESEATLSWWTTLNTGVARACVAEGHATAARLRSTTQSARHQVENRWNIALLGYLRSTPLHDAYYPSIRVNSFDQVHERLSELARLSAPLARAFNDAGFSLYAVGGSVRDCILDIERRDDFEIDFTTNARPDDIARLMEPLCSGLWEQGRAFGTIGGLLKEGDFKAEITTFRSEAYVDHSRKPAVEWGDSLQSDLSRRDFTINALALDVIALNNNTPEVQTLFDFFNGFNDLHDRVLRAPIDPEILFSDEPLRMLRAARFASRFNLQIALKRPQQKCLRR